jgi:hypothetical protein
MMATGSASMPRLVEVGGAPPQPAFAPTQLLGVPAAAAAAAAAGAGLGSAPAFGMTPAEAMQQHLAAAVSAGGLMSSAGTPALAPRGGGGGGPMMQPGGVPAAGGGGLGLLTSRVGSGGGGDHLRSHMPQAAPHSPTACASGFATSPAERGSAGELAHLSAVLGEAGMGGGGGSELPSLSEALLQQTFAGLGMGASMQLPGLQQETLQQPLLMLRNIGLAGGGGGGGLCMEAPDMQMTLLSLQQQDGDSLQQRRQVHAVQMMQLRQQQAVLQVQLNMLQQQMQEQEL